MVGSGPVNCGIHAAATASIATGAACMGMVAQQRGQYQAIGSGQPLNEANQQPHAQQAPNQVEMTPHAQQPHAQQAPNQVEMTP